MAADTTAWQRRLDSVPVEDITARAKEIHPGPTFLKIIGGILFAIGWVVAKFFGVTWLAMAWVGAALVTGWDVARGTAPPEPDYSAVMQENAYLRRELERMGA